MSYILEALKKADQERQRGVAPSLQTVHAPLPGRPKQRQIWPYLLVLALLLNATLLVWWMHPWQTAKPDLVQDPGAGEAMKPNQKEFSAAVPGTTTSEHQAAATQTEALQTTAARTENVPPAASQPSAPTPSLSSSKMADEDRPQHIPPAPLEKAKDKAPVKQQEKIAGKAPSAASVEPASSAAAPTETARPANMESLAEGKTRPMTVPKAAPTPAANSADRALQKLTELTQADQTKIAPGNSRLAIGTEAPPVGVTPVPTPNIVIDRAPVAEKPLSTAAPKSEQEVPAFEDLPLSVRRSVPPMSFSVLVYSDQPQERMLSINGKMMREGQEVASGLKLERITPDGAVLSYQDHRFYKGVF